MAELKQGKTKSRDKRRAAPGAKGTGDYFRVVVRPSQQFMSFRTQDVGDPGGLLRVTGRRSSGSWDTQAWLVSKTMAHTEGSTLIPDSPDAKNLFEELGSEPEHKKGDIFIAKDRLNIPEWAKPTAAQKRSQDENIKKAQSTRKNRK